MNVFSILGRNVMEAAFVKINSGDPEVFTSVLKSQFTLNI